MYFCFKINAFVTIFLLMLLKNFNVSLINVSYFYVYEFRVLKHHFTEMSKKKFIIKSKHKN